VYKFQFSEFPPKGLEIGYRKVWDEFEKIAFIQNKTLKNKYFINTN